jgi:hypothetical protein
MSCAFPRTTRCSLQTHTLTTAAGVASLGICFNSAPAVARRVVQSSSNRPS